MTTIEKVLGHRQERSSAATARAERELEPLAKGSSSQGEENLSTSITLFGMWVYLATEVLLFGPVFVLYAFYRGRYAESFMVGSHHMEFWYGSANTFVLILSSLTMALSVREAKLKRLGRMRIFAVVTVILGSAFLLIKGIEYKHHYDHSLFPGVDYVAPLDTAPPLYIFMSLYILGTGLHALHLTIGICLVLWLIICSLIENEVSTATDVIGLYWHFVDIVWVFLFPAFYLVALR